ncbi:MAG TPA: hypothetical protein VGK90_12805 [Rhizomicrobium sp.]|jgi:hypothetical protein
MMTISAVAMCALLAACDQKPKSDNVTINGQNGNVTISANGQQFSIKANGDKSGNFTMSGDNGHFTMKASDGKQTVEVNSTGGSTNIHMPDFVTSYPGAKVETTTIGSGASGNSGTFTFETSDSPATVIDYYKKKSAGEGLAQVMDMNMGPTTMFTAHTDGDKKVLQVIASTNGSGARGQVTWTVK